MNKKFTLLIALSVVLAVIVAMAAGSFNPTHDQALSAAVDRYAAMSKSELTSSLKSEFEAASEHGDVNVLIPIASVFAQRKDEFTPSEIFDFVLDETNDTFFRVTCLQLLDEMTGFVRTDSRLSSLLTDADTPPSLRQTLIVHFGADGGITQNNLETMAYSGDDAVGFHAVKKLKTVNPAKAYSISKDILENYETSTNGQLQSAVNVFSEIESGKLNVLRTSSVKNSDKQLMYSVATHILESSNYPQTAKDSVVLSIADMRTHEGIEYVIYNDNVDDIMKKTTVDRNYMTLIDILDEDGSAEAIDLVSDCMELWPINQVKAPLENALSKIPSAYSLEASRAAEALQHIEDEGIDANPKWNQ